MNAALRRIAAAIERMPAIALALMLVITAVLAVFAAQQQTDTDTTAFAPESDLAIAHQRVADEFGQAQASVQMIVDAGEGGDVVSPAGLQLVQRLATTARSTPQLSPLLADSADGTPAIVSWMTAVEQTLIMQGIDPDTVDDPTLTMVLDGMLADPAAAAQVGSLLSNDFEPATGDARAGLVIVRLNGAEEAGRAAAELALRDAVQALDTGDFQVNVFGEYLFAEELLSEIEAEMPVLLGIALLLIVGILFVTYRRVSDVMVGLTGLIITIVWTYGFAVLLGPDYLGVTGVMNQISILIPVLLVGLGIDFAIHLTSRYREELNAGNPPARSAHLAVISVGGALVLATITTTVGFLTNVVSPLPPIRDFGIFVAAGVFSAFIVMLLLVPSTRSLLDRRRFAKGTLRPVATGTDRGLGRVMTKAAMLSERRPGATLAVAAIVTALAAVAGSQVPTTFEPDDFVPPESNVGIVLASIQDLFGGDLDETTNVLVDGDLTDPAAANAIVDASASMADTDNVRSVSGRAQIDSPVTVIATLAGADAQIAGAMESLGYDGQRFAADADMPGIWDLAEQAAPQLLSGVLTDDRSTARIVVASTAGQQQAEALRDDLLADLAPVVDAGLSVVVVSDFLRFEEALGALTDSQTRGMLITLAVALVVLVGFFTVRMRTPMLGVIAMVPSALVVAWVAGSMWLLGISFNMMTAMVASLAIGIGVPYGIHITNRFTEDLNRHATVDAAIRDTVVHTGGALVGSATTTAAGFGVLVFASLVPMQQFGIITALTIIYSLIGAALIEPAFLTIWARRRVARGQLVMGASAQPALRSE